MSKQAAGRAVHGPLVMRDPASLKPDPKNPNTHPPEQMAAIRASIRGFGFTSPVLLRPDGVIGAGHGRVQAALEEGLTEVPTVTLTGLSAQQWRAYVIADNQTARLAVWNEPMLRLEILELKAAGFDLNPLGFMPLELARIGVPGFDLPVEPLSVSLADRFMCVPFSVLNAREGSWQERKRAWLAIGIESELGRGESAGSKLTMSETVQKLKPSADQALKRSRQVSPGGSPRPAMDYKKSGARGDGRGRAINGKG